MTGAIASVIRVQVDILSRVESTSVTSPGRRHTIKRMSLRKEGGDNNFLYGSTLSCNRCSRLSLRRPRYLLMFAV